MDVQMGILKDQLYGACQSDLDPDDDKAYDKLFTQDDLMALEVVPPKDIKKLVAIIGALTNEYLFIPLNTANGPAWRIRPEAEAAKYKTLTSEQRIAYSVIDNAGADGIWHQHLRSRTNIIESDLKKVLKDLEGKRLINSFTSVENSSKKMWIKASVKPSQKATGGPWFTDSDLDESFIVTLSEIVFELIKEHGAYRSAPRANREASTSPILPKKGILNGSASEAAIAARSKKRSADQVASDDSATTPSKIRKTSSHQAALLPLPAGFKAYPTVGELTSEIANLNITKGQKLKDSDIQQLVNVLTWDGRIEQVKIGRRLGYRVTRVSKQDPYSNYRTAAMGEGGAWEVAPRANGLTTAPCGRCPVFELCEEGGPVWAGGCEYFDQWLI